jgi:hypothetical protein
MKKIILVFTIFAIGHILFAQKKPNKTHTVKDANKALKEANTEMKEMLKNLSPDERKMMESVMGGKKIPSKIELPKALSDKQLTEAFDDVNRLVPKKDVKRIAAIKPIAEQGLKSYLENVMADIDKKIDPKFASAAKKIIENKATKEWYHMAYMLWLSGNPELGLYIMSKYMLQQNNTSEAINTYSAMLIMSGGEQWAIPLLEVIAKKYPTNSTILNNLAQAWFGLGEIEKSNTYIMACLKQAPNHSQANATKAKICESKGDKAGASAALEKSLESHFTNDKKRNLENLTGKKRKYPAMKLPKTDFNLGIAEFLPQKFPKSYFESQELEPYNEKLKEYYIKISRDLDQQLIEYDKIYSAEIQKFISNVNNGKNSAFYSITPFMEYAKNMANQVTEELAEKLTRYNVKKGQLIEQNTKERKILDDKLELSQKEEDSYRQRMEACPNCCKTRIAAWDNYLSKVNGAYESFYIEFLTDLKASLNEKALYEIYAAQNDLVRNIAITQIRGMWIDYITSMLIVYPAGISANGSLCLNQVEGKKFTKPKDFDDVACNLNTTFSLPVVDWSFTFDCKGTKLKVGGDVKIGDLKVAIPINYEYNSNFKTGQSTHKIGFDIFDKSKSYGKDEDAPITLETEIKIEAKGAIYVETDKNGISDIGFEGKAEAGGSVDVKSETGKSQNISNLEIGKAEVKYGFNAGASGSIKSILGDASFGGKQK